MRRPHGFCLLFTDAFRQFRIFSKGYQVDFIDYAVFTSSLIKASFYLPVFKLTRERFSDLISSGRVATRARSPWTVAGGHTGALPVVNSSLMLAASTYEDSGKRGILPFFCIAEKTHRENRTLRDSCGLQGAASNRGGTRGVNAGAAKAPRPQLRQ